MEKEVRTILKGSLYLTAVILSFFLLFGFQRGQDSGLSAEKTAQEYVISGMQAGLLTEQVKTEQDGMCPMVSLAVGHIFLWGET